MGMHVPLVLTSQASHWPVHSLWQQCPSTQWPVLHSPSPSQVAPGSLLLLGSFETEPQAASVSAPSIPSSRVEKVMLTS